MLYEEADKHWKNKEQKAREEQEELDAKIWWNENRAKLEHMDAGKCYEHLENQKLRFGVAWSLRNMIGKLKGP